jgi:hypothetical protein
MATNAVAALVGYAETIKRLKGMGYSLGLNLFAIPYDWR